MKKILPISMLAIITACPAMADDPNTIDNESMCVVGTLQQSANNSNANIEAIWSGAQYSENPGYYLSYANGTVTPNSQCPAGSYCEGFTNETFAGESMGIESCSDSTSGDFPYSAAGTTTSDMCYNTGNVSCAQLNPYTGGHGTATYGNSTNGNASYKEYNDFGTVDISSSRSGFFLDTIGACEITALTCDTGYHSNNTNGVLSNYVTQTVIWNNNQDIKYRALNGDSGLNSGNEDRGSHAGMSAGEWSVGWPDGTVVHGQSTCTSTAGTDPWSGDDYEIISGNIKASNELTAGQYNSTDAQYCWCKMDGYSLTGGSSVAVAGAWAFYADIGSAGYCANDCADYCANYVHYSAGFRGALFGSLGANMACEANTINLNWYSVGDTVHETNTCTYDGTITLPETDPTRPGYVFSGWRLRTAPAQQQNPSQEQGD